MHTRINGTNCVAMKQLNEYLISFVGLKLGKHQFDYQISDSFFEEYSLKDFDQANVHVQLLFEKKSTLLELHFKHKGTVSVPCDVTGEIFDLPIKGKLDLIVQFGEAYNDDNEELLILPHGEYQINVAQYIYEMIVLSVPQKRIHPGVKDGSLATEALDRLDELSVSSAPTEEIEENIDPRWAKLKQLLTDK